MTPTLLLTLVSLATPGIAQSANTVPLVITDTAHPINSTSEVRVVLIDQLLQLEEQLSVDLPSSPAAAQAAFTDRMTAEMGAKINNAHQDIVEAWSLGISKTPAVVVAGKYVVYGDPDVERALLKIRQHREAQP